MLTTEAQQTNSSVVSFTVTCNGKARIYELFLPALSRLGKPTRPAPEAILPHEEEVWRLLRELSRRNGIVILVTGDLSRRARIDVSLDVPQEALKELAEQFGCEVRGAGLAYTLVPRDDH